MRMIWVIIFFIGTFIMAEGQTMAFDIFSATIQNNAFMSKEQAYDKCGGGNISPDLRWDEVPKGTRSLALVVHDPDAPREHGWYHWIVVDIPVSTASIAKGTKFTKPARELATDYGAPGYNGPCPPIGHGVHHYHFVLYALDVERIELTPDMPPHEIELAIRARSLAQATITGLYERK